MSENQHILIIDDDVEICRVIKDYLGMEGFRVSVAHNSGDMDRVMEGANVDIVLLDVVLPKTDGLELARLLRAKNPHVGIIMLTGRGETIDRIIGLEMGADDYLTKPFHLRELLARIKSVGRRAVTANSSASRRLRLRFAGWNLDLAAHELSSPAGERVRLTSGEFDLLVAFVTNPNQVLSRDQLLDLVCERDAGPFERTVDVQVGRLRRKLDDDPKQPHLIKTLRGGGYLFAAPVETVADGAPSEAGRQAVDQEAY